MGLPFAWYHVHIPHCWENSIFISWMLSMIYTFRIIGIVAIFQIFVQSSVWWCNGWQRSKLFWLVTLINATGQKEHDKGGLDQPSAKLEIKHWGVIKMTHILWAIFAFCNFIEASAFKKRLTHCDCFTECQYCATCLRSLQFHERRAGKGSVHGAQWSTQRFFIDCCIHIWVNYIRLTI